MTNTKSKEDYIKFDGNDEKKFCVGDQGQRWLVQEKDGWRHVSMI